MMETTFQRISRKTGRKPVECKCQKCKNQCVTCSCLGTPQDIEKIIDAGYADRIKETTWASGILLGVTDEMVPMFQAEHTPSVGCTFFKDGLCELHNKGLKPTEGRLSHHTLKNESYEPKKGATWAVAKEWLAPENAQTINRISEKLKTNQS